MHRICTANSRFGPRGIHIRSPTPCHFVVCHAAVRHGSLSRSVAKQLESASAGIPVSSTSLGSDTVTAPSANLVNTVNSANWANAGQDEAMDAASARISVASTSERVGQRVTIAGWLSRPRRSGALLAFAAVRDWTGSAQVVVASPGLIDAFLALSPESVVTLSGFVRERPTKDARGGIDNLEIALDSFHVINAADPLPFETHPKALMPGAVARPNEETMLKYRYIELRQPWLAKNLQTRSRASFAIRSLLHSEGFMEVETPCLFKSTPEGAREFLVPTRQKGFFFALPQSPQQFKQVLMAGGVEKYYQFARCFRDESIGSDRQQEFTQVDMELSFVTQSDIMTLIERLICRVWNDIMGTKIAAPFKRMSYNEAMTRYGSDKPDTRYDFEIQDVTRFFQPKPGNSVDSASVTMEALVIPCEGKLSKSKVDDLVRTIHQESFPYYEGSTTREMFQARRISSKNESEWTKAFASDFTVDPAIYRAVSAKPGDVVFLNQRKRGLFGGHTPMGRARLGAGKALVDLNIINVDPNQWNFLWVVDFPLFTPVAKPGADGASLESTHHPFTAPIPEDAELLYTDPERCRAQHYDIVLNGQEIGGGSIRAHEPRMQRHILQEVLKLSDAKIETDFGHLLDALRFGCPSHGGIALGYDRLVAILCRAASIREVIAFPKMKGGDLFAGSPTNVRDDALREYHIQVRE